MIPVVTASEMGAIDAAADVPLDVLVGRAGSAVARAVVALLGGCYGRTVVVVAGPGNNGADGRVAAELLRQRGVVVQVLDGRALPVALPPSDLLIDAAFGTGFRGEWAPPPSNAPLVLAVDLPTGLDADTGVAAPGSWRADRTVTFAAAKPGHVLGDGPDLVGELEIADIGLDVSSATIGIVTASDISGWVPARARIAHKWTHAVRMVAGSPGMTGAAALACGAALRAGAGMVTVSMPGVASEVADVVLPAEAVSRSLPATDWSAAVGLDLHRYRALLVGPGLGRSAGTAAAALDLIVAAAVPVTVDGDGLFALAESGSVAGALTQRSAATVLTPHDGEFAQLTGHPVGDDRIAAARGLAADTSCTVLLKGPTTVVATPDGRVLLVDNGDERLATAGSGDVLSGIITALLARGVAPEFAAASGAWIHAAAAAGLPSVGLTAGDLIAGLPLVHLR